MSTLNPPSSQHWLHHEFLPWSNRYVYWLKTPLGALFVASLFSLLCGLLVAPQGLVVAGGTLVVIALGIAWPWLGLRGVSCELAFSQRRTREGQPVVVVANIVNRWPWPVWGLEIEHGFFAAAEGDPDSATVVALARVGGWSRCEFRWEHVPAQRGRYPRAVPRLATAFPFGLWKATQPILVRESLLVWPRTCPLDRLSFKSGARRWLGGVSQEHTGDDGERCGVRAWRQGDTLRGVHWALTARHNRLIVCERQGAAQSRTAVRVDTSPAAHVGVGPSSTLEWSLRIAASVCELLLSQGVVVSLELGGTPATFAPGAASVRKMLDLIAECEAATQAASPAGPRSRREDDAGFLIDIGTDRRLFALTTSGRRNVRRIVLGTAAFHARPEPAPLLELRTSVIVIDDAQQPLEQLANRWRQNGGVLCGT